MYYFYKKRIENAIYKGILKVIYFPFIAVWWLLQRIYDLFFPFVEVEVEEEEEYTEENLLEEVMYLRREVQVLNDRIKFLTSRKAY